MKEREQRINENTLLKVRITNEKVKNMKMIELLMKISMMNKEQIDKLISLNSGIDIDIEKAVAIRLKDSSQSDSERMTFFELVDSKKVK